MTTLEKAKHIAYIKALDDHKDFIEYWMSEHLRMNGLYWGITALFLLKHESEFQKDDVIQFIQSCYDETHGGFGSFPKHDSHLLSTLSALQILKMYDILDDTLTSEQRLSTVRFIKSLQLPDGSFQGDRFGEVDTRFVYTAIQSLSILEELDQGIVDGAVGFILRCQNFDGGFGMVPGAESHAAQCFTCLGTLAICGALDKMDQDQTELLVDWLSERQVISGEFSGGLNGRPEKLPDVCYSWWVLSCLSILKKLDFIDGEKLKGFILKSQDLKSGGISDRPDNQVDVYHTLFGIAGLSLLGYEDLVPVDPVYCMPCFVTNTIKKYPY
ncbi:unnamed protein product [Ambrosiozyma monospora]|uniref:Geranylgeranyl transferase type-2 subunit beta n=1 Tax=Ambrosiozyma monospora TaxID=43982 RepID=A0A9W6YTD7_AMBMO|nr:unnamed protein product [Ambrosiozyma monospora]